MSQSVYVLLYNNTDELLLQLRSANDDSYPLHYDFSAAGRIETGETHEQAAHRELQEELGVDTQLRFVGEDSFEGEQMFLYRGVAPTQCEPGDEVEEVLFASVLEIEDMITAGKQFHPEFLYWFGQNSLLK